MSSIRLVSHKGLQPPSARQFSHSCRLADRVPPESPSFIRLPRTPQSEEVQQQRARGFLPVPRNIFPKPHGDRKVQPGYLDKTSPRRHAETSKSRQQLWKNEIAQSRRESLASGIETLWKRKSNEDRRRTTRINTALTQNRLAAQAPESEDDRLTRSTVLESLLDTKVYLDPERYSRADRSRSKVLAGETLKRESRRDALMELYISASQFITAESELKDEIEQVFSPDFFKQQGQITSRFGAGNAWGVYGKPPSLHSMLESTKGTSTKLVDKSESEHDRSVKRQKRIAEEFTGGKM